MKDNYLKKLTKDLKSEFEAVLKISLEEVQKKMDKALGRNQNIIRRQNKKTPF